MQPEEDEELKLINARKMAELRRRAELASAPKPPKERPSREIVLEKLYDRGDEVLDAAYARHPRQAQLVVEQLAKYIRQHPTMERVSGGELLEIFRTLGLRVSLNTTIKVQERGKFIDLKDKFKLNREGMQEEEGEDDDRSAE